MEADRISVSESSGIRFESSLREGSLALGRMLAKKSSTSGFSIQLNAQLFEAVMRMRPRSKSVCRLLSHRPTAAGCGLIVLRADDECAMSPILVIIRARFMFALS